MDSETVKKNGVGPPPGFIPICFETLLSKMDIISWIRGPPPNRKKKTAWVRLQGLYLSFLRHFYPTWILFQGCGNRKKNGVGPPPGFIPIFFETLLSKMDIISRMRKP